MKTNINLENEIIVLSLETVSKLISENSDSALLYLFYHKTSKLQKTNSIWATNTFAMKGLGWGRDRFYKAKKVLQDLDLIEEVRNRDDLGKITACYLVLKYLKSSKNHSVGFPECGKQETNALSSKKKNALSSKKKKIKKDSGEEINQDSSMGEKEFNLIWESYKNKAGNKAGCMKTFISAKYPVGLLSEILFAIKLQEANPRFEGYNMPMAATWINQQRWNDTVVVKEKTDKDILEEFNGGLNGSKFKEKYGTAEYDRVFRLYMTTC